MTADKKIKESTLRSNGKVTHKCWERIITNLFILSSTHMKRKTATQRKDDNNLHPLNERNCKPKPHMIEEYSCIYQAFLTEIFFSRKKQKISLK